MNDEIKEILDRLNNIPMGELYACCLEDSECKIILDYITNLQEENEDLKDRLKVMEHFKNSLQEENERLTAESTQWEERTYCWQDRAEDLEIIIDKAIEVIDLIKPELWNISNKMTYRLIDVKNILNGGDDK